MAFSWIQPSFAGGEIGPSLYGRIDMSKYQVALRKCDNFIVRQDFVGLGKEFDNLIDLPVWISTLSPVSQRQRIYAFNSHGYILSY
jgi:hypothetical protein